MSEPTNAERGLPGRVQLDDPAFLAWAAKQGKPIGRTTSAGELGELLAQYEYELRERDRREEETKRIKAEKAEEARATAARAKALQPFAPKRAFGADDNLRDKIRAGWRRGDPALKALAEAAVTQTVPLGRWLYGSHGADRDEDRWSYMRYYLKALNETFDGDAPPEERLLDEVVREEKIYLAQTKRREEQLARAARPGLQREALRAWARKQPMNPADNFESSITYYDLATARSKPDWVDRDIKSISQEDYTTTISYARGSSLSFPAKSLDFTGKYEPFVIDAFVRRHKKSGRLVPFVLYDASVDLYRDLPAVDALSSQDRVFMALPYMLTPAVTAYYQQDPYFEIAGGLIEILQILALRKGLPFGAPLASASLSTGYQLTTRGLLLGRNIVTEVTLAVRTYGVTTQAAAYLGRSTYTYYLANAVAVNTNIIVGADIGLAIAGQDMGPMSVGDTITMATKVDDAARAGIKVWKRVRADVLEADAAAGKAVSRVVSLESISDDVAKVEFDLGKKVTGEAKKAAKAARGIDEAATDARLAKASRPAPPVVPAGQIAKGTGKIKLAPDPRRFTPLDELDIAMKQVAKGLERLSKKYNRQALDTIKDISADAIRESGIRPSDLAKLPNSLARAGQTVQQFVNNFHNVPGFDRVLLGWMKRHYWNTRLKTPGWTRTQAFYTGTSYVMKYATGRLDPKFVRFEWPVSINDTRWGEEVFARYVDIVVSGGAQVKPGQQIQIEVKSWTEFVLRMKTAGPTTQRGGVGYQLLRDTALFDPNNIRWVFDAKKVTKDRVIAAFEKVIRADDYLRLHWGGKDADPGRIRELLDKVIEVF